MFIELMRSMSVAAQVTTKRGFINSEAEVTTSMLRPSVKIKRGFAKCEAFLDHIWSNFGPIIPNHLIILKPQILGALLTASSIMILFTNFYPNWTKND